MVDAAVRMTRALGIVQGTDVLLFLACLAPFYLGSTAEGQVTETGVK